MFDNARKFLNAWSLGKPTHECLYCGAILWFEKHVNKYHKIRNSKFSFCYQEGKMQLQMLKLDRLIYNN